MFTKLSRSQVPTNTIPTTITDEYLDAFGNLKISQSKILFYIKQNSYQGHLLELGSKVMDGGLISYESTTSSSKLRIPTNSHQNNLQSEAILQSNRRINYQPGLGLCTLFSYKANYNTDTDNSLSPIKKAGVFDEKNGLYFEFSDQVYLVLRSDVGGVIQEVKIAQKDWNGNRLDGSEQFPFKIDYTKCQIFGFSLEWLGAGIAKVFHYVNGKPVVIHIFNLTNQSEHVYIRTPTLPFRFEIKHNNSNQGGESEFICCSAIIQGDINFYKAGFPYSIDIKKPNISTTGNVQYKSILSFRLKPGIEYAEILPNTLTAFTKSRDDFVLYIVKNPTIIGDDTALWESYARSNLEFDTSRDNEIDFTKEQVLFSVGVPDYTRIASSKEEDFWYFTRDLNTGQSTEIMVAVDNLEDSAIDIFLSANFRELIV